MMENWAADPEFLFLDEDEFPPEIVSRFGRQSRRSNEAPQSDVINVKESLIILQPLRIEGLKKFSPLSLNSFACEISMNGEIKKFRFGDQDSDGNFTGVHDKEETWEVMEYYGPTQVNVSIIGHQFCFSSPVASNAFRLESFWSAFDEQSRKTDPQQTSMSWGFEHDLRIPMVAQKVHQHKSFRLESSDAGEYLLQSAKSATTMSAAVPLRKHSTVKIPEIVLKVRFRVVHLRNCLVASPLGSSESLKSDLHVIAKSGSSELMCQMMRVLSRHQVLRRALSVRDGAGNNVLEIALLNNNFPVVSVLLRRAGHWCFQGMRADMGSPLHKAVVGGGLRCTEQLLKFLRRYSEVVVDWSHSFAEVVEWKDSLGDTPLAVACGAPTVPCRHDLASLLIRHGAEVGTVNPVTKRTPLMLAAGLGDVGIVRLLLAQTMTPRQLEEAHSAEGSGGTVAALLLSSATSLQRAMVKLKCRPCDRDELGRGALHFAALGGHEEVVSLLLDLGVPLLDTSVAGEGVFHCAAQSGNMGLCKLLIEVERKGWRQYRWLASERSLLGTMTARSRLMEARDARGHRPADTARVAGHEAVAQLLLAACVDVYHPHSIYGTNDATNRAGPSDTRSQHVAGGVATESGRRFSPKPRALELNSDFRLRSSDGDLGCMDVEAGGGHERPSEDALLPTSAPVSRSLPDGTAQVVYDVLGGDEEACFDDRADDEEYTFALAPKSTGSQGYYAVASFVNAEAARKEGEEAQTAETAGTGGAILPSTSAQAPTSDDGCTPKGGGA